MDAFHTNSIVENDTQRHQRLYNAGECDAMVISEVSFDAVSQTRVFV